ncbi:MULTISPECIES: GIY-YIG nuclease family protein [Tenacibaculum]|uniref:Putative endonuclease n=1 Tax=Tenacibaculum caenipelagi TaxID=1325435 RepID=A0A4R6TD24_9FLAO|nr:GIY-YIG nuclease family protein [Tenacibaculum caenipelagi]TDQ27577.1 putative endonuclease [Tenacibaculum caenipelagi]
MHKTNHQYYIYIITNKKDGVLYIGVTNNLERRIFEHKNKLIKGFSSKYNLDKLIYFEEHQFIEEAIKREKNMKKWKRAWKINLVVKENPNWDDLAKNWYN